MAQEAQIWVGHPHACALGVPLNPFKTHSMQTEMQYQVNTEQWKAKWTYYIWNFGSHDFRYDFTIFFIYMNSYMNP